MNFGCLVLIALIAAALLPPDRAQSAPPATQSTFRLSIPEGPGLLAAEQHYRDTYAPQDEDRAIPSRRALAKALLAHADLNSADAAAQYVLLRESRNIAIEAGDPEMAIAAVERIAREFAVDARAMKVETLQSASLHAAAPADYAALAILGMGLVDEMMSDAEPPHDCAALGRLGMATATWAAASHDSVLVVKVQEWNHDVQARCAELSRVAPALAKLSVSPDDKPSNLAAGRFYCLFKNDWPRGLAMLAKGSDAGLARLAKMELTLPTSVDAQETLASGWWDQAQAATGAAKTQCQQRACYWYAPLLSKLTGQRRALAARRIDEVGLTALDLEKLRTDSPAQSLDFDGSNSATAARAPRN